MAFGLVFYVVYRKVVEGTSLTERVTVPELSLKKQSAQVAEYSTILVPVFGTKLDDDIVAHGRAARRRRAWTTGEDERRGSTSSTSPSCR